jgi:ATP-dependent Clp protease ATP-binding subunit ClpA
MGFRAGSADAAPSVEEASDRRAFLRPHFRVELVNRLSDVIEFNPLTKADLRRIVDNLVREAAPRLAARKLQLELTDAAYDALIRRGYDEEFGARELERVFEQRVIQAVAERWLAHGVAAGTIRVDADAYGARS